MDTLFVAAALLAQHGTAPAAANQGEEYRPYVAPASGEAADAIARMKAPEGFQVKLWAAEPHLANPVAMYVSNKGEVYVAETYRIKSGVDDIRDHMDWLDDDLACRTVEDRVAYLAKHLGEKFESAYTKDRERVKWVGDTDGDGVADASTVFADNFGTTADGIIAGVLEHKGKVYAACMPSLWELSEADGDHIAEAKRILSTGYGVRFALIGHDLHGLRIGPDGKLYFSCGDRGLSVPTQEGGRLQNEFNGAVLRCNLDGSNLEIFATGLRNPQELVFDEHGELWTVDNNSDGGDKARLVHVVEGMDAGWRQAYQWITEPNLRGPWNDEGLWKPHFDGQAAYIVPPLANICDGPSGLTYNPGTALGGAHPNTFFICDFRGDASYSGIHTFTVKPKGAGFELDKFEKFLWGTLVTDCDFGPDGALWFSDWVEGWNKTGKGRMYRLEPNVAHEKAAETQRMLNEDWARVETNELVARLGHVDQRVRQFAQFELVTRDDTKALLRVAQDSKASELARLHAVWGVEQCELDPRDLDPVTWGQPLAGEDAPISVQVAALHFIATARIRHRAEWEKSRDDEIYYWGTYAVMRAAESGNRRLQRAAFEAAARLDYPDNIEPITLWKTQDQAYSVLAQIGESDPVLRNAIVRFLVSLGARAPWKPSWDKDFSDLRYAASTDPDLGPQPGVEARVAVVVALRRLRHADIAEFLGDAESRVVTEAARGIYDEQILEAMPALARLVGREDLSGTPLVRRVLNANFRLGQPENAAALANFAARGDADELHRWEALDLLSKWTAPQGRDAVTGEWWPIGARDGSGLAALAKQLADKDIAKAPVRVVDAWIELVETSECRSVGATLLQLANDGAADKNVRAAALRAAKKVASEELEPALAKLVKDPESAVRAAALRAIAGVEPVKAFPLLEEAALHGSVDERRVAYSLFANLADSRVDTLVASELRRHAAGLVPREVALDLVELAEARQDAAVGQSLASLRALREFDAALASFADSLYGGDKARGKEILRAKAETECLRCHKIEWGEGGQVGPDLVGVGKRLARADLLASICDPNRRIADGYQGTILFLENGTNVAGIVVREDRETIVVRTPKDELVEVAASDVENRRPDLSAMPQDVSKHISRREMRDLIEYLANL
ncbi:MAG: HEAT repeat domain-containing protein [Planctomycetota bacterium]|nr:HEAT repeat domain-containing protein [Planctomycetota bacterium]